MTAAKRLEFVTVDDYLARELRSPTKHEYLAGAVYAMAGARVLHNRLASRIVGMLYERLRGKPCEGFDSDARVRISNHSDVRFYYPDAMIVCNSDSDESTFQTRPVVLFEVLSSATRRIDEKEKKDAYLSIPSLRCYIMVEQATAALVVYRRTETGFEPELYSGLDSVIPLPEVGIELPLEELYRGLELTEEPIDA